MLLSSSMAAGPATPGPAATPAPVDPALDALKPLGPLQSNLTAWFSFDQKAKGGVGWSAEPIRCELSSSVQLVDVERGKVASFSNEGSVLKFTPSFTLGPRFTLAAWASFPIPKEHRGIFFHGLRSVLLRMQDTGQFSCWVAGPPGKDALYSETVARLKGWHHIALSVDGKESKLYLDGQLFGSVPFVVSEDLVSVGNQPEKQHQHWMMVESMDDLFIFDRELTEAEIAKVMPLRFASFAVAKPAATPRPPRPPRPPTAGELIQTFSSSLVCVTGKDGGGSGFIITSGKDRFLVTNAHVTAGIPDGVFKTLDGKTVPAGTSTLAKGADVFLTRLADPGPSIAIMEGVDGKVVLDDEVVVLGNEEGAGVVTAIRGRVVGIGPDRVEVDAPFLPGHSGSPIIHTKTGQVIGVATYARIKYFDSLTGAPLRVPVLRRFGYRLDTIKAWDPVNSQTFRTQAAEMQEIEKLSQALIQVVRDMVGNKRISPGVHSHKAIQKPIDDWLAENKSPKSPELKNLQKTKLSEALKRVCQTDVAAARPRMTYDYFQRQLVEETELRTEIAKILETNIKALGEPR
jgi:hypothetical protein